MINVIVDQNLLRLGDGLLNGMKLLRQIQARSLLLDHPNDMAKMSFGSPQPPDDFRVRQVDMAVRVSHAACYPLGEDTAICPKSAWSIAL